MLTIGFNVSETESETNDNVTIILGNIIIDRDTSHKTAETIERKIACRQSRDARGCTEIYHTKSSITRVIVQLLGIQLGVALHSGYVT
jgi:hypothetical protein